MQKPYDPKKCKENTDLIRFTQKERKKLYAKHNRLVDELNRLRRDAGNLKLELDQLQAASRMLGPDKSPKANAAAIGAQIALSVKISNVEAKWRDAENAVQSAEYQLQRTKNEIKFHGEYLDRLWDIRRTMDCADLL